MYHAFLFIPQLQIKHAVTQAEIQLLKRKVRMFSLHADTKYSDTSS